MLMWGPSLSATSAKLEGKKKSGKVAVDALSAQKCAKICWERGTYGRSTLFFAGFGPSFQRFVLAQASWIRHCVSCDRRSLCSCLPASYLLLVQHPTLNGPWYVIVLIVMWFLTCISIFALQCLHVCMFALHVFALHLCIAAVFPHWFLEMLPGLVRS